MEKRYGCAVVTGASAGLGEEFASQLGGRVGKLVLVARREERLVRLAEELGKIFPEVEVKVVVADLADAGVRERLVGELEGAGFSPDLLINNAGLGDYGEFMTARWEDLSAMLRVNVEALTHLSYLMGQKMVERGGGAILNVSSVAGTLPMPDFAVYAASKAYVSSFSEALRIELSGHGVGVMHLCPGPVKTEFGEVARREGAARGMPSHGLFYVSKEEVVREALLGLEGGRARVFPGKKIAVAGLILGALPLWVLRRVMGLRLRRR